MEGTGLFSLGDDQEALRELDTLEVVEGDPVPPGMEWVSLVLARILAGGAVEAFPELLGLLEERARTRGDLRLLLEVLLIRARYAETLGYSE